MCKVFQSFSCTFAKNSCRGPVLRSFTAACTRACSVAESPRSSPKLPEAPGISPKVPSSLATALTQTGPQTHHPKLCALFTRQGLQIQPSQPGLQMAARGPAPRSSPKLPEAPRESNDSCTCEKGPPRSTTRVKRLQSPQKESDAGQLFFKATELPLNSRSRSFYLRAVSSKTKNHSDWRSCSSSRTQSRCWLRFGFASSFVLARLHWQPQEYPQGAGKLQLCLL